MKLTLKSPLLRVSSAVSLLNAVLALAPALKVQAQNVNYAQGAPISCTNCCGQGNCGLINDGNHATYAQTLGAKADNTATVDLTWVPLGVEIDQLYWNMTVTIAWGGELAKLQVQEVGGTWTTIAQHTGYGGGMVALSPPRRILQARIWANSGSHFLFGTVYRFFELEAWGPPLNACCFTDGSCQVLDEAACAAAEGIAWTPGIGCDPNPCPQPGACCFSSDSCELLQEGDCYDEGGSFWLPGYGCDPSPCAGTGACCFTDGTCQEMEAGACVAAPGAKGWVAAASCGTSPCPEEDHFDGSQDLLGSDSDPVNTATGDFYHDETDLTIASRGRPLVFARYYNSLNGLPGPLGTGWRHSHFIVLDPNAGGDQVGVRWGDGRVDYWTHAGSGYVASNADLHDELAHNGDGTWTLKRTNLDVYQFGASGRLLAIADKHGNTATLSYSNPGYPNYVTGITDPVGRTLTLSYDAGGRLTGVADWTGRHVDCVYDGNGRLWKVTDVLQHEIEYTYDASGYLATIEDQRDVVTVANTYDANGRVQTQADPNGNVTMFQYGARGSDLETTMTRTVRVPGEPDPRELTTTHLHERLYKRQLAHEDPLGTPVTYGCDGRFNRNKITDRNGRETNFQYDPKGNVTQARDADDPNDPHDGGVTTVAYDPNSTLPHVPRQKTTALGHVTQWAYDAPGDVTQEKRYLDPGQTQFVQKGWTYNSVGQRLTETDERGNVHEWVYDANGLLIEERQWDYSNPGSPAIIGRTWYGYDDLWRRIWVTDGRGSGPQDPAYTTHYVYDNADRLIEIHGPPVPSGPTGIVRTFGYDEVGNRTSVTDGNGNTTTYVYDNQHRLVEVHEPLSRTTKYAYDELGRKVKLWDANNSDPNNPSELYIYDDGDRLVEKRDAVGNSWTYTYDDQGNLLIETDPGGVTVTHTYDALNRRIRTCDELNNCTRFEYDQLGRLTRQTDATNKETNFTYDALGRLVCVVDAASGWTEYTYDATGNLTQIEDARDEVVSIRRYDALNRLVYAEDGNGNSYTYEYDAVGNQIAVTDANGQRTELDYDAESRLMYIDYPGDAWVQYEYDNNGNRLAMIESADPNSPTVFEYDNLNRLTAGTDRFGKTVGYGYDTVGNRTSLTYPADAVNPARTVIYGYDAANRLTTITDWASRVTAHTYNGLRVATTTYPNGLLETRTYDNAGRLDTLVTTDSRRATLLSYDYDRNGVGSPTSVAESGTLQPTLEQLVTESNYDTDNRLVESSQGTYQYDANGNLISRTVNNVTTTFAYDVEDRLVSQTTGASTVQHVYDGDSNRIARTVGGVAVHYVLDRGRSMSHVLCETDPSGNSMAYYIHGPQIVARIAADGTPQYYHTNDIGSVAALTNATSQVTDRYAYEPFGLPKGHEGATQQPFTYVGGLGVMADADDLYFMRARFYDPDTGRFLGKDSVEGAMTAPQGLHRYVYGLNNPVVATDPSGEWFIIDDLVAAGTGAIGGAVGTFVGDLIGMATGQQTGFSSWETYAANTAGAAAGAWSSLYVGPGGLAVGATVSSGLKQVFEKEISRTRAEYDLQEFAVGSLVGTATSYIGGKATGKLLGKLGVPKTSFAKVDVYDPAVKGYVDTTRMMSFASWSSGRLTGLLSGHSLGDEGVAQWLQALAAKNLLAPPCKAVTREMLDLFSKCSVQAHTEQTKRH